MTNTLIALVGERCETVAFFFRKEEGKREGKEKWREKVRWRSRRRTEKLDRSRLEEKKKKRGRVAAFRIRLLFDIVRLVIDRSSRPTRLPLKLKNEPSHKGHFKMEEREKETNFVFRFLVFFFFFFFFFFFLSSHPDSFRDLESHAVCVHASTRDSSAEREELYFAALLHCFETQKEKKKRKSNEKVKARKTKKAQNFSPLSLSLSFFLLFNASQRPRGPAEPQQKGEEKHKQRRQRQAPDRALKVQAPAQEERRSDWSCRSSSSG